jgi:broad specificity phosphatase PhoE
MQVNPNMAAFVNPSARTMTATRLCVVSHGDRAWNAERRAPRHPEAAAFSSICSGDPGCARQTAETAASLLRRPAEPHQGLREHHSDVFRTLADADGRR